MAFLGRGTAAGVIVSFVVAGCSDEVSTQPSAMQLGGECRQGRAYVDADGDGLAASAEGAIDCAGPFAPVGYSSQLGDCDDSDPELTTSYLVDADGDGFSPSFERSVCGPSAGAPVGAVATSAGRDCDDNDPTLVHWARRDADGDGYVAEDPECFGLEVPPGYLTAYEGVDCDDERADIHPHAIELWSDSFDTDCDGLPVIPEGCLSADCAQPVEVDSSCSGADLAIVEASRIESGCSQLSWVVVLANHGSAVVPSLTIHVDDGGGNTMLAVPEALAPGTQRAYKLWSTVVSGSCTISAWPDVDDCRAANNEKTVEDWIGDSCRI